MSPNGRSRSGEKGFTLVEALVALAVLAAFAAVLAPALPPARHIAAATEAATAPQTVLRRLLDAPFDRADLIPTTGQEGDLAWSREIYPAPNGLLPEREGQVWRPVIVRLVISGSGGPSLVAETVRLVRVSP